MTSQKSAELKDWTLKPADSIKSSWIGGKTCRHQRQTRAMDFLTLPRLATNEFIPVTASFTVRFVQEIHRTCADGVYPLVIVRPGGDKNDRNASAGARQISLQFQAVPFPACEDRGLGLDTSSP